MVAYVRTVKTRIGSVGRADRVVIGRGSRSIEHIGSADETELAALKTAAK